MSPVDFLWVRVATDAALAVLVEGSLLLGATWAAATLLRRHGPAVRHTVWTAGFVVALVVPAVGALLPQRSLGVVHYPTTPTAAAVSPAVALPFSAGGGAPVVAPPRPGMGGTRASARPGSSSGARMGGAAALAFLAIWGLGALALVARLVAHRIHVGRLTRRGSRAAPESPLARRVRREARRMGIRRPVEVVYTPELSVPVTWGIVRPVLLLPPDAVSWPDRRLRAVTVHELAHVRRWDALSQQLAEVARAVYWANPLVWIARRRAAGEREGACDDEVVRRGMASSDYAAVLVAMARRGARSGRLRQEIEGGLAMARRSRLEARVSEVLAHRPGPGRHGGGATLAACLAVTLVGAPLAGTSLAGERPPAAGEEEGLDDRVRAVRVLGLECDEISLGTLSRALADDPEPTVRTAAARALGGHDDPRAVRALAHAARDTGQEPAVRRAAIHALGRRDSRAAARALGARLLDPDPHIRRTTVDAMARMKLQSRHLARPLAMAMLEDRDPTVRAAAADALESGGCEGR